MRCPKCGSKVEKGNEFCENCGTKLKTVKKSKLPVVLVSLTVVLIMAGGIGVWILTGEYHSKSESEDLVTDAADLNNHSEQETESEESQPDRAKSDDTSNKNIENEDTGGTGESDVSEQEDAYDITEGGIHKYEYVVNDCSWSEAYQKCLESGGYLARINSREEYDYILSQINQKQMENIHFRIGGRRDENSQDYYWVDDMNNLYGEKINSEDYWCSGQWMTGEPSFSDKDTQENCLDIFYYQKEDRWVWNDVPDDILKTVPEYAGKLGYICEYEN